MLLKTPSSENQALLEKLAALSNVPMEQLVEIWETAASKQAPFQEQIIKSGLCNEGDYQLAVSQVIGLEFVDNLLSLPNEFQEIFTLLEQLFQPRESEKKPIGFLSELKDHEGKAKGKRTAKSQ